MTTQTSTAPAKYNLSPILFLSAVGITMILFFIDEGYYNFNWMADLGSWVAFAIYVLGLFFFQVLLFMLLPNQRFPKLSLWLSICIGAIVGFWFVAVVLFGASI